ncbi:indole-3-glycerol-phosphate synthase [Desulfotomaculum sp. 1211_IL3151]|uniref:indole-3-glycerol-phosphate synthase n=1 Tax=Desulfotomaculum sp. 1211_IL3151 TaxID=3084055 RepID=UPI002FD9ED8F
MRFTSALEKRRQAGLLPVIPDLKRRSPKEGDLFAGRELHKLAEALQNAGAPVLSVVTESQHFGGSLELLKQAVATGLPVLRKDFIQTARDIEETAQAGAAAALLIVSMLDEKTLVSLLDKCKACGLDALVEVHTAAELGIVNLLGPKLVGINNRDILRLEKDNGTVENTSMLAALVKQPALVVSESAIRDQEDARLALQAGADAILVGTALLQATDLGAKYSQLQVSIP